MAEFKNQNVHVLAQDGSQSSLLQSLWFAELENERLQQDRLDQARGLVQSCTDLVAVFKQSESAAKQNGELSAIGVERAVMAAQEKATEKLASVEGLISSLDNDAAKIEDSLLRSLMTKPDDIVSELRKQQARVDFGNIADLMQPVTYLAACQAGTDDLSCAAVEEAGVFGKLLDDATIAKGRAVRASRQQPDKAQALREIKVVIDVAYRAVLQAKRDLTLGFSNDPQYRKAAGATPLEVEAIGDNVNGTDA